MSFNKSFYIGDRLVGEGASSFIIAELSCNHRGDLEIAKKSLYEMKEAGVDCVKLQTSNPEKITLNCTKDDFIIKGGTLWDNRSLYDLYSETYTPWEWHKELFELSKKLGLVCFSSPFDLEAVDFLESLDVPAYKIASFEISDIKLIEKVAKTGKPVIFSTGVALEDDIELALNVCKKANNLNVAILKCTSAYPTPLEDVNINMLTTFQDKFRTVTGISDHTKYNNVAIASIALGAKIIEKHFIIDRSIGGPDAEFSLDKDEFKKLVEDVRNSEKILGTSEIIITERVKKNRQFMRSLYFCKDLKVGDVITDESICSVRPGYGLHPKYYDQIIGKTILNDVEFGDRVELKHFKGL